MPCAGNVPIIVASGSINYTGASLSATTIFTPSAPGTYRVSLYLSPEPNVNYPAGAPAAALQLTWTDANAGRTLDVNAGTLDTGSSGGLIPNPQITAVDLILQAVASAIQVSANSGSALVTYDLYYVVEQLA